MAANSMAGILEIGGGSSPLSDGPDIRMLMTGTAWPKMLAHGMHVCPKLPSGGGIIVS